MNQSENVTLTSLVLAYESETGFGADKLRGLTLLCGITFILTPRISILTSWGFVHRDKIAAYTDICMELRTCRCVHSVAARKMINSTAHPIWPLPVDMAHCPPNMATPSRHGPLPTQYGPLPVDMAHCPPNMATPSRHGPLPTQYGHSQSTWPTAHSIWPLPVDMAHCPLNMATPSRHGPLPTQYGHSQSTWPTAHSIWPLPVDMAHCPPNMATPSRHGPLPTQYGPLPVDMAHCPLNMAHSQSTWPTAHSIWPTPSRHGPLPVDMAHCPLNMAHCQSTWPTAHSIWPTASRHGPLPTQYGPLPVDMAHCPLNMAHSQSTWPTAHSIWPTASRHGPLSLNIGDIVYEAATKAALCKLQKLQNKALRICLLSDPRASTTLVHQQTRTPFLGPRRIAHLRNYMYSKQTDYNLVDNRDIRTRNRNATTFKVTFPKKRNLRRTLCLGVPWIGMHSTYTHEILILSFLLKRSKKNGLCCKMKCLSNWDVY